ncbi:MAG: hypothetical protein RLZZ450_7009, partial [Pseudomonadota bacterium]
MASPSAQLALDRGEPSFRIEQEAAARGTRLLLSGRFTFADAAPLWNELRARPRATKKRERIDLDMQGAEYVDGGAMALLAHFRAEIYRRGGRAEFVEASESVQEIVRLYRAD